LAPKLAPKIPLSIESLAAELAAGGRIDRDEAEADLRRIRDVDHPRTVELHERMPRPRVLREQLEAWAEWARAGLRMLEDAPGAVVSTRIGLAFQRRTVPARSTTPPKAVALDVVAEITSLLSEIEQGAETALEAVPPDRGGRAPVFTQTPREWLAFEALRLFERAGLGKVTSTHSGPFHLFTERLFGLVSPQTPSDSILHAVRDVVRFVRKRDEWLLRPKRRSNPAPIQ
jgi:hypothetical protein